MKDAIRRNPMLGLPSIEKLRKLPDPQRAALAQVLLELRADAQVRADASWKRHKAPMAGYWKAVAVYAGHTARALR